ncbi:T9SS type A sorting domain-containing protein [Pontibacter indicus]|uniref:Por secretion system C-terminal sorting domain-containing protein n=1 Tax=Pontibacter indicus TaxID=1317125 RepID=A0A1R3XB40_9BACT|nr:T9SS type A sorting domain-containing protein [Pontibacter indicus]SIT88471.1 Por secretion system C-terminal sorting domain-containing protein [Pontibacter indicus]
MTTTLLTPDRLGSRSAAMLLALLLSVISFAAHASEDLHMVPIPLEERIKAADIIVEGEVVAQRSFWDARQEFIYTAHTVRLFKVFKGELQERQVEVITDGGTVGLAMHTVSSALQLRKGQQGMFFLTKGAPTGIAASAAAVITKPYGSRQGFVRYDVAQGTAADPFNQYKSVQEVYKSVTSRMGRQYKTVLANEKLESGIKAQLKQESTQATQAVVVAGISPTRTSAGTGAVLTITGTGFGNTRGNGFVEFPNADDGGTTLVRPYASDYLSWTNNQIRVIVPSYTQTGGTAGTGRVKVTANDGTSGISAATLVIEFAYSNVVAEGGNTPYQPALIDANRSGGYTIQFAPSLQSRAAAQEGFRRAVNNWVCTTNVNWIIGATTTTENAADDGRSVIRFAPPSVTGQSVLARTISKYRGCVSINGTRRDTIFWLTEFDMEINSNISWQYGPGGPSANQFDFETVILHELGHAHQLGHVILPNTLMHYNIARQKQIRDLTPPDIAGANLVLNRSLSPPICGGRSPMIPKLDGDCNLASEIFTFDASFNSSGAVNVIWTTSRETGVARFVVQRSPDGQQWENVGEVPVTGQAGDYTFTDSDPLPRRSYYRLRVVYTDNTEAFSGRVQVLNPSDLRVFKVYPNPIGLTTNTDGTPSETLRIEYLVRSSSDISMQLYDLQGRLVRDVKATVTDGTDVVEINVADLAAGTYVLRWSEGSNSGVTKVVKAQ